jgi:hypothetical protein
MMPRYHAMGWIRLVSVLVFALGFAASASAASPGAERTRERLAIHRFEFSGHVPAPLRESLARRLSEGLTSVGFQVLPVPGATAAGAAGACADPACLRGLADRLGVRYLVGARVDENAKTFEIALELHTGRTGMVVGVSRERCEICGSEEVGEKMGLAASALRARLMLLASAPVRFVVRTRPHGATVQIDERPSGRTPVDLSLAAGPHRMRIEHPGYFPLERSFTVVSGVEETLNLDLVGLPSPFPFRTAGWTAMAAGALLAAGGVYLLRMDGSQVSCSPAAQDGDGNCPRIYRTNVLGASLLGGSAVCATLGAVWLFLAPAAGPRMEPDQALGWTFGARGRF